MSTVVVTETWNTAAAKTKIRRARRLAKRGRDSSGELGFILSARGLGRVTKAALLISRRLRQFMVLDYLDNSLAKFGC